jgi:hypothetical protein
MLAGELVREAFRWLEDEGFRYVGEERPVPRYTVSTFERGPIAVLVHWDGTDGITHTVLARGHRWFRWRPGRQLGLSHLDPSARPAEAVLPDPTIDPAPLRDALAADSRLLRTRGAGLLTGERAAWAELAQLQRTSQ